MCSAARHRPSGGCSARSCRCRRSTLLLLACIGIVVISLGVGALTWLAQLHDDPGRPAHGQRSARRPLRAICSGCRSAYHSRQRVGDLMYRITADSFAVQTMIMNGLLPILSAVVLLGGMLIVLFPIDPMLTLLSLTIVPVAVRADRRVQPQDRRRRDRGARSRQPGLFARAMGHVGDQGRAGLHQGGGRAPPLHGREPREPARHVAPLQLADALFGGGQRYRRGRHRARHLCRRARRAVGQSDARPAARLHLLSRAALSADQPDHAELGPDRRRRGSAHAGSSRCSRPRPI